MSSGRSWRGAVAAALIGGLAAAPADAVLTHRYSFSGNANDSVGSLHWTVNGGAAFSGGQVMLDGIDDFLSLATTPLPTTFGSSSVLEVWGTYAPGTAAGSRIFDAADTSTPGVNYLYLTPAATPNTPTPTVVTTNTRLRFSGGTELGPTTLGSSATGQQVLFTAVIDGVNGALSLYRNGSLVGSVTGTGDILGTLGSLTTSTRLGGGESAPPGGDLPAFLSGSLNEFRVYDDVLTPKQILVNAIAGPDTTSVTLADKTWVPAGAGDWNTAGNWAAAGAPAAGNRALIANGGTSTVAGSPAAVGAVQIDNGTLTIGAGAVLQSVYPIELAPGDANTATINVNSGGRLIASGITNDGLTGAKALNVDGGVVQAGFANADIQFGVATTVGAAGMILDRQSNTLRWNSALAGTGTITVNGAGTLALRGGVSPTITTNLRVDQNPLFMGEVIVNGGTIDIGQQTGAFGRGGSAGWGKLTLNNATFLHNTQAPGNGSVLGTDLVVVGNNVMDNLSSASRPIGLEGSISGAGTLRFRKSGLVGAIGVDFQNGLLDPDVTNAGFTGRIVMEGNIAVRIRHEAVDFPNAIVELADPGALLAKRGPDLNGTIQLGGIAGVAGSRLEAAIAGGNIAGNPAVTYELGFAGANVEFAGTIQDNNAIDFVSIRKIGSNTQTFSGPNTYSGTTVIDGGKLLVNGTHQQNATLLLPMGDYTVNAGGTLGGTGVIGSVADTMDVAVSGGTLAPGAGIGTLTVEGNVTFSGSSHFAVEALGATTDKLIVNTLNVTGAALDVSIAGSITAGARVIAEYDALVGTFAALNAPAGFSVSYATPGQIILNTPNFTLYPGDFDKNGTVNALDLTKWRGDVGLNANSDADNDGDSDGNDFLLWQRFLGSTQAVAAAGAVPEPASSVMLASMLAFALAGRCWRSRGAN